MTPTRVFVRLPNWLGDVLLARPLLHALRSAFPRARIAGVAPGALLDLLAADGVIDSPFAWPADAAGRRRAGREVVAFAPEAALVLPPSFSSAWLAWRSGARLRIGYAHEGRGVLLTHALPRPERGERHLSDEYLELARALWPQAIARPHAVPPLEPAGLAREAGQARLGRLDLVDRPFAILGPGAVYGPAKRWPPDRFAAVGSRLAVRGLAVLVCGTREESATCDEVARRIGAGARSLAGQTPLPELSGICAAARIAVCNDSGLAHLCAALGAPTVSVFGSTSSAWTAPLGRAVRIVQRPPVCSPCFRRTCRIGYRCLAAVSAERVTSICERLLEDAAA